MQPPREYLNDAAVFRKEVLQWIEEENLWNIWVPKAFGGLECSLSDGLKTLQALARLDGSLGWTVTLCSGANFFIGNLRPEVAREVFAHSAILGGIAEECLELPKRREMLIDLMVLGATQQEHHISLILP